MFYQNVSFILTNNLTTIKQTTLYELSGAHHIWRGNKYDEVLEKPVRLIPSTIMHVSALYAILPQNHQKWLNGHQ